MGEEEEVGVFIEIGKSQFSSHSLTSLVLPPVVLSSLLSRFGSVYAKKKKKNTKRQKKEAFLAMYVSIILFCV